jgi:hypothetical protein
VVPLIHSAATATNHNNAVYCRRFSSSESTNHEALAIFPKDWIRVDGSRFMHSFMLVEQEQTTNRLNVLRIECDDWETAL